MSDPAAPELARLDAEIGVLAAQSAQAHQAWQVAEYRLTLLRDRRTNLLREMAARDFGPPAPAPPLVAPPPAVGQAASVPGAGPESSTRTVQNALFILGGLLLGTAAIVFTAVAWATYGVTGRAAILAAVTVLTLATPLVALRRRLTATAETFAAVGLLLVVLDGYAAWYVNLFGVADGSGTQYAGLVALVAAVVAAGYGAATGLTGPRFFALLAAAPVAPLLAEPLHPSASGWSLIATAVAALNLIVAARHTGDGGARVAMRVLAWVFFAFAVAAAAAAAAAAESLARTGVDAALAGLALVFVAAALVAAARASGQDALRGLAAGIFVLAVAIAGSVFVAVVWPAYTLLGVSAVAGVVAVLTRAVPGLRGPTRSGANTGGLVALGGLGLSLVAFAFVAAVETIARAVPPWRATLEVAPRFTWQLLAAIGIAAVAAAVVSRAARLPVALAAAVMGALALPDSVPLAWWAPSTVDLVVGAALAGLAVLPRPVRWTGAPGAAAAILVGHALLAGLARPASTAAVLFAVAALGMVVAALGRIDRASQPVAGGALLVGLVSVPPAVGSALIAADRLDVPQWWVVRLTVAAVVVPLLGLVAVRRWSPSIIWYAYGAALISAGLWPVVAVVTARGEPIGVYGGLGLLLVAATLLLSGQTRARDDARVYSGASSVVAGIPGAAMLAAGVLRPLVALLGLPYSWLGSIWSGAPAGVGLTPTGSPTVAATAAWALGLAVLAAATASYALTRRVASAFAGLWIGGPTLVIVGLVAAKAPWPSVPATTLLLGLLGLATAAIAPAGAGRAAFATLQGLLYVGAGLSGALPLRWTTIAALASIVVSAGVVGAVGRTVEWRIAGWVVSIGSALTLAAVSGLAADLAVRDAAWIVLAVAVASLGLGAALTGRRPGEATAVSAAAHAGAVVAVLLTVGWTGYMATLSAAWGVAVGLRALAPRTTRPGRAGLAATGAAWELVAWWLLLADRGVTLVEAYTVPLAAVGLLAGFAALRARPELRSWVSYGPALAAGFLPSLALALSSGTPWRRLLLGLAALLIVVAGSVRRRQAPVVSGGIVLVVLALNELSRVWDLLPRWIPLATGGLLLVGLAVTYERRRRDLARLRAAVGRMT